MQFKNIVVSGYMNEEDLKKLAEVVKNILEEELKDENKKPRPSEKNKKKTDPVESEKNIEDI